MSGILRGATSNRAAGVRETTEVEKRFSTVRSVISPTAVCRDALLRIEVIPYPPELLVCCALAQRLLSLRGGTCVPLGELFGRNAWQIASNRGKAMPNS
jgi:hypothetical protein